MPNLSFQQYEHVAALHYDPGFALLLDAIQAQVDHAASKLHEADAHEELSLLARWRALREILATLRTTPEEFALILAQEREIQEEDMPFNQHFIQPRLPIPADSMEKLRVVFENRTKSTQ